MALETLAQGKQPESPFIVVNESTISFTIQDGPIKKNGINGCQVSDMIAISHKIIQKLNERFPCEENAMTLDHLTEALAAQKARTENREKRGVEGFNKK